jgi:hypothetical protein
MRAYGFAIIFSGVVLFFGAVLAVEIMRRQVHSSSLR